MKFHDPLTDFCPELDEAMNRLGESVLEMTPYGEKIALDGSLQIDCECETCQLSSECKCKACTRVFGAVNARGAERIDD